MNIAECAPTFKSILERLSGLNWIQQALIATAVAIAALAAGWKPVLAFYRWCIERYDGKILRLFKEWLREAKLKHSPHQITLGPTPVKAIAEIVKRSEKSVYRSLRRLEERRQLEEVKEGWILRGQAIPVRPRLFRL